MKQNLALMLGLLGLGSIHDIGDMPNAPKQLRHKTNWRDGQGDAARDEALTLAAEKRARKAARFLKPNAPVQPGLCPKEKQDE